MPIRDPRFPGAVLVTLMAAIILTVIPVSEELSFWRPEWIVLTLVHWALVIRDRLSLSLAFGIGLIIDTLYGSLLGHHALGYLLVTYFSVRLSLRMTAESFLQQFALLFVILGLYMLVNLWILRVTTGLNSGWLYWASLISSLVAWPLYHSLLGYFQLQRKPL